MLGKMSDEVLSLNQPDSFKKFIGSAKDMKESDLQGELAKERGLDELRAKRKHDV